MKSHSLGPFIVHVRPLGVLELWHISYLLKSQFCPDNTPTCRYGTRCAEAENAAMDRHFFWLCWSAGFFVILKPKKWADEKTGSFGEFRACQVVEWRNPSKSWFQLSKNNTICPRTLRLSHLSLVILISETPQQMPLVPLHPKKDYSYLTANLVV